MTLNHCKYCGVQSGYFHLAKCICEGVFDAERTTDIVEHFYKVGIRHLEDIVGRPVISQSLLAERETTHGSFEDNAHVSQSIKEVLRHSDGWHSLSPIEREALDLIATKISRIMSGKPHERQHWEDISGYADLIIRRGKVD